VSYRQLALWLTDAELSDLADEVGQCIARRAANRPGGGRTRRLISQIVIPTTSAPARA
jgi:hypothetical protein